MALSSLSTLPDTTVTAGRGINKNSVSSSITRQQFRQQAGSLCTRRQRPAWADTSSSHIHSFTLTAFAAARTTDGKTSEVRRRGKQHRRCWTRPVSNQRSSDRCNVFTKQTSVPDVREIKKWRPEVAWPVKKKPGLQAGISVRTLEVFQRDEKTACHTRIARVSRRICLMLLASSIPGSSGC